jgi:hypothetical protein
LTPAQQKLWQRLTAERELPPNPPQMPRPTDADVQQVNLNGASPVFRAIQEQRVAGLSEVQGDLLNRAREITELGLFWISRENADRVAGRRAEFIRHAEQFVLLGILTEEQAQLVQSEIGEAGASANLSNTLAAKF